MEERHDEVIQKKMLSRESEYIYVYWEYLDKVIKLGEEINTKKDWDNNVEYLYNKLWTKHQDLKNVRKISI